MHALVIVSALLLVALLAVPGVAQDADALRRELEQMRRSFETMKEQYQKSIDGLSDRLKRLESTPAPTAVAPAPPAGGLGSSPMSPMDLIRPREPFSLYGQRGSGQLLFDMGVAGDFVGAFAPYNVPKSGAGTFGSQTHRFLPR